MPDNNNQNKNNSDKRRPNRFHGRVEGTGRACQWHGCQREGEFRAPPDDSQSASSGDGPGQFRWFCLDHIREFNQRYNYFDGMSSEEIFEAQKPSSAWDSQARPFAGQGAIPRWQDFRDPLDAIGARFRENLHQRQQAASAENLADGLSREDRRALHILELDGKANRRSIRQAYSRLVRRYHPDRNGGDRSHEKALANVIAAYTHLKTSRLFRS